MEFDLAEEDFGSFGLEEDAAFGEGAVGAGHDLRLGHLSFRTIHG